MTLQAKPPKPRVCTVCKTSFTPQRIGAKVCSPYCALTLGPSSRAKALKVALVKELKADAVKRQDMRSKPQLVALAQKAFNKFIRARDAGKPCISCGKPLQAATVGGAFDCGHYRSVGSAVHMRFVEDNAHGQCKHCNRHLAGNHVAYRAGLIERIGLHSVELIERDNTLRKYTKEGLQEVARHYNAEAKQLKAGND
jgi:uncharacterized CHY-type Zn-finger protein